MLRDQLERLPVQQLTVVFTDGRRDVVQYKMVQLQILCSMEINGSTWLKTQERYVGETLIIPRRREGG